jgi:hypothetical protein
MNRHLKVAFFMAPVLAMLGYFLAGYFMKPKEVAAQQQQLRLLGSCMPRENACIFTLGDLELKLISNEQKQQHQLAVISSEPVSNLSLALGNNEAYKQFPMMKSDNGKYWQIKLENNDNVLIYKSLRMALSYKNKPYYAESTVTF